MDLATRSRQRGSRPRENAGHSTARYHASHFAVEEINAYIAVRDGLLEEAEQDPNGLTMERLVLANNFVAHCLKPTRQPYQHQSLPEIDAVRELKRCHAVTARIAKLRARTAAAA